MKQHPSTLYSLFAALSASLLCPPVQAQDLDRSLDTQLVYPSFSPYGAVSVDSPRATARYKLFMAGAWQLERAPLELYKNAEYAGAAIPSRNTLHMGASMGFSPSTSAHLRFAAIFQEQGEDEYIAPRSQLAFGDVNAGFKVAVVRMDRFWLAPALDLWLPAGTKESWVGERGVRYVPSLLAHGDLKFAQILGSTGVTYRQNIDTGLDMVVTSELNLGLGVLVPVRDKYSVIAEATSRHSFAHFFTVGGENPAEAKLGARILFPDKAIMDVTAGTGLDYGYGTADLRILVSVIRLPPPPKAAPPPIVVEIPPPKAEVKIIEQPPEEVAWKEGQLAQVHQGKIIIKDPIQFEFDKPNILPESFPIMQAVTQVMNDYPQIEFLLIEGHASEEGTNLYNYELSNSRAQAVFQALVDRGVRPERLGYRGMGETVPVTAGTDEAALARNRRVEFKILKVRDFLDVANKDPGTPIILPWSGEARSAPTLGDKMLSADANPILQEQVIETKVPGVDETKARAEQFLKALKDDSHEESEDPFLRKTITAPEEGTEGTEGTQAPPATTPSSATVTPSEDSEKKQEDPKEDP